MVTGKVVQTSVNKSVKGFGMGLQCAPQMANLACYVPERDYAATRSPEEVFHNYRFIDDILTLSGKIPSQEEYGMEYKSTRKIPGEVEYLGMKVKWEQKPTGDVVVNTAMLQREETYPIRIIRYPSQESVGTAAQKMILGQFIRAQRICSTMQNFKQAVVYVTQCAMRRGYARRGLHSVWGKFLAKWWTDRELRGQ